MAQGDPLPPTIFNVLVDAVVCHWESLVEEGDGGDIRDGNTTQPVRRMIREREKRRHQKEEGHTRLRVKAELFYTNGGMVASTDLE